MSSLSYPAHENIHPDISTKSEYQVKHFARAKYVPDFQNGGLRLASVCESNRPIFTEDGWELNDDSRYLFLPSDDNPDEAASAASPEDRLANIRRATRRAQLQVFDIAVCNNFDLFSTLTFAPEKVDRHSYEETYHALKIWLSNKVQRKGLKYVAVPEYHPKSKTAIHFHMLSNSDPVDLVDLALEA